MTISKRMRFEILRRDNHKCRLFDLGAEHGMSIGWREAKARFAPSERSGS